MPVVGYCRNLHNNLCPCFVCSKKFLLDNGIEDLIVHICFTHHVVIENIDCIADFQKYMDYYVQRYKEEPLESFTRVFTIEVPEKDAEPREEKYYLVGGFLPEDEAIRKNLHARRLKEARKQQKKDLSCRNYIRHCFYCHETLEITNAQWINHLRSHGFQLGQPDKLLYIEKFMECIEDTFRSLHCLYCEVEFESCRALMHHMEEKNHLKIHPNNRFYDQFYMINYVEFGKTWLDFIKEKNKSEDKSEANIADTDDSDWSSWGTEPEYIMCLFCKHMCKSWDGTLLHMQVSHRFDFKSTTVQLSFYQQVKMVNYIRKQLLNNKCINCSHQSEDVINHMEQNNHFHIPDGKMWNHPEYFFSSVENDMFLCHLEDGEDEGNDNKREKEMNEVQKTMDSTLKLNTANHSETIDRNCLSDDAISNDTTDLVETVEVEHSESYSRKNSLNDEVILESNLDNISSVDEFDEAGSKPDGEEPVNTQKILVHLKEEASLDSQKLELLDKDMEVCSPVYSGAGDCVLNVPPSAVERAIKQIREFGDS